MKNSLRSVFYVFILSIILLGCFESTGTITGRITDSTGDPISGASILLDPLGLTASSDANGYYTINDVPWGDYTVTATLEQLSYYKDVTLKNESFLGCDSANLNPNTITVADIQFGGDDTSRNPVLTVNVNPYGAATVILDPPGGTYTEGTTVTVTVTPDTGYEFLNWYGEASGTDNPLVVVVNSDVNVIANLSNDLQDLIAHYKFNENTGNIAHDSAGTTDATIVGATWTTGISSAGVALYFDGDDDYVETLTPIMTVDITTPFTYEVWYKADRETIYHSVYLISPLVVLGNNEICADLYLLEGTDMIILIGEPDNSTNKVYVPAHGERITVSLGAWYYAAATYDGSTLAYYHEGQLAASTEVSLELNTSPTTRPFMFGDVVGRGSLSEVPLMGAIDEIRIYNRALSEGEILQSFQDGPTNN